MLYTLRIDRLIDHYGNPHTTYGINLIDRDSLIIAQSIPSVFGDIKTAVNFIALLNRLSLSSTHFVDVVLDAIC